MAEHKITRTWDVQIDQLNDNEVELRWPNPGRLNGYFVLTMDRKTWEDMGRPGETPVTVTVEHG